MKKIADALFSKQCAYISFILAGFAYIFVKNATFAYGWIAELYPLGDAFIPTLKGIILACVAISFGFIIAKVLHSQKEKQSKLFTLFNAVFLIFFIISIIAFIYSFVLVFRLDTGLSALNFVNGLQSMTQDIAFVGIMAALVLPLMFSKNAKEILRSLICALVIAGIVLSLTAVGKINVSAPAQNFPSINLQSENVMKNATIINETLKDDEKADAANLLDDSGSFWTPQQPGNEFNNSVVEIQLDGTQTFNTAVIEEIGNEVQYFRLQVFLDDKWVTVYQSEKIQSLRICSFDSVTTDKVRLSIDKFRDNDKPAQIKSLSLYNETAKDAENFEVTAYQRLDGDVPTEILKKGEDYVNNYARFYDVYTTVIVFAAVH